MLEASWSGRFAGIERFSEPESREKSNAFPRFFEQLLSQTYLLTKMFIDFLTLLQLLLKLASIWFPTSFSASTAPGLVRSLPDWRSHSGNDGRSRMSSAPKAPQYLHVLTVSYSTLNFCPFLFCFHASLVSAPCQTCLRSKRGSRPLLMCQFKSLRRFKQISNTLIHSFLV